MSGIAVHVKTDADKAKSEFKGVGDEARKAKEEAKGLGDELKKAVAGPAMRNAVGQFNALGASVTGLRGKVNEAGLANEAFNNRMRASQLAAERLRNTLSPLEKNFASVATELQRQEEILKRIHGPQQDYNRDVASLNSLLRQGKLSAKEYADELARADGKLWSSKRREGPDLGADVARRQGGTVGGFAADAMEGGLGAISKGAAIGATVATAKQLAAAIVDLGDAYTHLSHQAELVVKEHESISQVLDAGVHASDALNSSLSETLGLLDNIRGGTAEMNMTSQEQERLALAVGSAIRLENKSLAEAASLTEKLEFAMASGTINGRELKGMFREYGNIAEFMTQQTGKSRSELIKMANEGKITGDMLVDSFSKAGGSLQAELGERLETTGEKWQKFKDKATVAWGGVAQIASQSLGKIIDVLGEAIDPFEDLRNEMNAAAHAATFQMEIEKKMSENREKLIRTSATLAAMQRAGVDAGPLSYDVSSVEKYERLRSVMAELGHTMDAVWSDANAKQLLYEREGQKITEQREAEKQAEQVLKVWRALNDVNDLLVAQGKAYDVATDKVAEYADAARKLREANKLDVQPLFGNAAEPMFTRDNKDSIEQVRIDREGADAKRELLVVTGKLTREGADAQKRAIDLKNATADLKETFKSGALSARDYASALKALGVEAGFTADFLKKLNEPAETYGKTITALNFLFKTGKIDAQQYNDELMKIMEATPTRSGIGPNFSGIGGGDKRFGAVGFDSNPKALDPNKSVTAGMGLPDQGMGIQLTEQLERQRAIMEKIQAPMATYKQSLADIDALLKQNAITQAQATALTKAAATAYKSAAISTERAETATEKWNRELAELRQNGRGAFEGMKNGLNAIKQSLDESAKMQQIMQQAFDGVVQGIADAGAAGEDAMASLEASGRQLVKVLLVEFTKLMIIKGLASAFGGPAAGGIPLPGFASGGMIQPGGSGGTDSQIVAFRKSPDETVRVTTPSQERQLVGGRGRGDGQRAPVVKVINVNDPNQGIAAMDSRRGQRQIINTVQQSRRSVRGTVTRT